MKKFLKHTLAILLVVCMMASVLVPVSAITEVGEPYEETKTYNFLQESAVTVTGKTVYPADATGEYKENDWYFWATRDTALGTSYATSTNFSNYAHGFIIKLNNIPVSADGKYTFTINNVNVNSHKPFYFIRGDAEIFPPASINAIKDMVANDTAAGAFNADGDNDVVVTADTKNLGDYIVDGSVYIAFCSTETVNGANTRFKSFEITYTAVEVSEVPAATVGMHYSTAWGDYLKTQNVQNDGRDISNTRLQQMAEGLENGDLSVTYVGDSAKWGGSSGYFAVRNNHSDTNVYNFNGIQANAGVGGYFVLKIAAPAAGTYSISVEYPVKRDGSTGVTSTAEFFFIPESEVSDPTQQAEFDALIAGDTAENAYYKGKASLRFGTCDFSELEIAEGEDYYYVVVRNQQSGKRIYLTGFSLTGTEEYMDLASAQAAATSKFNVVKLVHDHDDSITIPANGYILDLNGYTVDGNINSIGNGSVIDSTDGTGKVTGNVSIMSDNNGYLPLKDGTVTRFFKFDAVVTFCDRSSAYQENPVVSGDYVLMWFDLVHLNSDAYALIASGNSGLSINASLLVNDEEIVNNIGFAETVKGWAGSDHTAGDYAMVVAIANAAAAGEGSEITLDLTYSTTANTDVKIDYKSLSYTVPTAE